MTFPIGDRPWSLQTGVSDIWSIGNQWIDISGSWYLCGRIPRETKHINNCYHEIYVARNDCFCHILPCPLCPSYIWDVAMPICTFDWVCRRTWTRWWCWICSGGFRRRMCRCCWWTRSRGSRPTSSWPACWCRRSASDPRWSATSSPAPTRMISPWSSRRSSSSTTSSRR